MRKAKRVAVANPHSSTSEISQRQRKLLILEPDALTRWSLETYLTSWFEIRGVASVADAERILSQETVDALVLSDSLDGRAAKRVEHHARAGNACVLIVYTGTHPSGVSRAGVAYLEKPFQLARLARLLRVPPATSSCDESS